MTYREEIEGRQTNPLTSTTGSIIFAVADRAIESDGSLVLNFRLGREIISFRLR